MMFRWRCERLGMVSYSHPCADARRRDLANCVGCPGAVGIEEMVDMAPKTVERVMTRTGREVAAYKVCKIEGCDKQITRMGLCWSHLRESGVDPQPNRRKGAKTPTKAIRPVAVAAAVSVPMSGHVVLDSMLPELRRLFDARLECWRSDLVDAAGIKQQAELFLDMCEAVEGLGY